MQTESYSNSANIVSDNMSTTKTINIIAVPSIEKSERLLQILRGMNLTLDSINPTVLNNFTCLPTYAILFILYDFSIRQHTAENVSNHLQSSINFIVSESQIPSNLKLPFYESQQQQQYLRDPRVIQPPYSMPMEPVASYAIPSSSSSSSSLQQQNPYDYYSYDNNHIYSIPPPPSTPPSSSISTSPFHHQQQHIIPPPHPLHPSTQSHNNNNNNNNNPLSSSSSTSSLSSISSSSHSIYNSNNNGLKSSNSSNNDEFRSRSRSPPRHPSSPVHLPYELEIYYRELIRTGKIPEGALDHRSLKAVEDLGVSKGKDALRALSETNIYAIRNVNSYFMKIVQRCRTGYLILDGVKRGR